MQRLQQSVTDPGSTFDRLLLGVTSKLWARRSYMNNRAYLRPHLRGIFRFELRKLALSSQAGILSLFLAL
jgi:hypothetical protein